MGIFVFALSGALMGVRKRLDVVGMAVLAEITALGGGIVRDLVLNVRPAAFQSVGYVVVPLAATVVVFFFHPHVARVMPAILVFDAAGLGLFCAVGTAKALDYGLSPLHAALLGVTTAVGGGMLRDMLAGRDPHPAVRPAALRGARHCSARPRWPACRRRRVRLARHAGRRRPRLRPAPRRHALQLARPAGQRRRDQT